MRKQCKLERRVLFVLLMLIGSLPSFAYNWTQYPYNTYKEDSWNDYAKDHAPKKVNGVYEISSPEELAYISYVVEHSTSSTEDQRKDWLKASYKLVADLDMKGHYWTPIGADKDKYRFNGTFDGNGHTIKNMYVYKSGDKCGLFAAAEQSFTIQKLVLDNWAIEGNSYVGLLVGIVKNAMQSSIDQVRVYHGHLSTHKSSYKSMGGLIGEVNQNSTLTIKNSYVDCELSTDENKICEAIGEFIGKIYQKNKVTFTNCMAKTAENNLYRSKVGDPYKFRGGFVGIANNNSRVILEKCGVEASNQDVNIINKATSDCSVGLLVGALHCTREGRADADAIDCFVMNTEGMKQALKNNRDEILFGRRSHKNINVSNLSEVLTEDKNANRSIALARMNKYGAHMGLYTDGSYLPLPDETGSIISMGGATKCC